mmetsp:Transcript_94344/g.197025  ORF Transcript_94344/g.197025 Transcript_94344/m.197025 type:complete len:407 (-) Transcript_94344:810-2030(-)
MASSAPVDVLCMACEDSSCDFKPVKMQRRPVGPEDVLIDMKYCGVCHSDLHVAANHWAAGGMPTKYSCVPGHELAGVCIAVGEKVTKVKVGDHVGVGCMVDSCLECKECLAGNEQKCKKMVQTYNQEDRSGRAATYPQGGHTLGGYTSKFVVHEKFSIVIPKSYPLECAGPVLCSGVTMYEPMKVHGVTKDSHVGIVGLGGLGGMGIKLAKALGCKVSAITRSFAKEKMAKDLGADNVVASTDDESMLANEKSMDLIINTIPSGHNWGAYQGLLKKGGKQVLLGIHSGFAAAFVAAQIRKYSCSDCTVVSSAIGGIKTTEEVLALCAKNNIYPEVEVVPITKLSEVYTMLDAANDSGKRYVLDIEKTLTDEALTSYSAVPPTLGPNPSNLNPAGIFKDLTKILFCY